MSYCRWSSDCHQSDVYVYADVSGGFTTHVATRKRHPLKPVPVHTKTIGETPADAFIAYWTACSSWVDDESNWEWRDIDHVAAGQTFSDDTAKDCADRLRKLKAEGVNVPQYAIDDLDAEAGGAP